MFIDAINPDGTVNPAPYKMIRNVYDEMSRYEPFLGGEPVEDVAIYFSSDSKMDFAGKRPDPRPGRPLGPELSAPAQRSRRCRALQQAHIPFGIITRKQLSALDRYKVILLPNILRMDSEEAAAFRDYVHRGGRLYASRYTSLTETSGLRRDDFMLGDVFGCHFKADDLGTATYLLPRGPRLVKAIRPQAYLSHMALKGTAGELCGTLRLADRPTAKILATLTLPYANDWGTINDQNWSSIHSSPPWHDTPTPAIVRNRFGKGRAIYSAADIECMDGETASRLFRELITDLLGPRATATADTHPAVWMSVTHQPDKHRFIVGFLNYQSQLPPIPIAKIPFTLRPPPKKHFTRVTALPTGKPIKFTTGKSGTMHAEANNLEFLQMLSAQYR